MIEFSIYILIILILLLFWILFLILKTLKRFSKRNVYDNKTETIGIIIFLIVGIIVFPWIFTQSIFSVYNCSDTGQIGDTIGGITSPFINGIGAVLVYLAFKEQVNSSNSAREEKRIDLIIENLNRLENDPYKINDLCTNCLNDLSNRINNSDNILKLTRVMREFQSITIFITTLTENKDYVENKLFLTWKLYYEPKIILVNQQIVTNSVVLGISFIIGNPTSFNQTFVEIKKTVEKYN